MEQMTTRPEYVEPDGDAWRLRVWVQPGAKKDEVAGLYQGCLKIRLAAPAVDNKANKALLAFVAKSLGLKPRDVELVAGQTSRRKTLNLRCETEPPWPRVEPGTV